MLETFRTYPSKIFRRVFGLFWPNFRSSLRGLYTLVDIVLANWIKNRFKRTEKSTETFYLDRFKGAKEQIQKEFDEIDAKYKGCYLFLELAKFKGELNALLKQVSAKL